MAKKCQILFYSRRKRYGFLSNMYLCPVKINGNIYKSVEHYYQSRKARKRGVREWIANAPIAFFAFIGGRWLRKKDMISGWDKKKLKVMERALYAKFAKNKRLRKALLKTGDSVLHEDSPTDMFWGARGEDHLGKLLMKLRARLSENTLK